jgi:hypothetical protein
MNSNFIEGFLQLKIDGYWYVGDHKLKEGTLFEILQDNKWVMLSMEQAQGAFYCFPMSPLEAGNKVRVEIDPCDLKDENKG